MAIHRSFCPLFSVTWSSELLDAPVIAYPLGVLVIALKVSKLEPPRFFCHNISPLSVNFTSHISAFPLGFVISPSELRVSPASIYAPSVVFVTAYPISISVPPKDFSQTSSPVLSMRTAQKS